jgi:uncharacterized damage-inducible protein DinB
MTPEQPIFAPSICASPTGALSCRVPRTCRRVLYGRTSCGPLIFGGTISLPFDEYRANTWRNSNKEPSPLPGNGGISDKPDARLIADGSVLTALGGCSRRRSFGGPPPASQRQAADKCGCNRPDPYGPVNPLAVAGTTHKDVVVTVPSHRADMFMDLDTDPREGGPSLGDERETLVEFLRCQRLTLQLKCEGLDAAQLACRAVEPSTMSLLGLLRHMAEVERCWFRRRFAGQEAPKRYQSDAEPDGDFDGAVADQVVVDEAWAAWRDEVAFAEQFARQTNLGFVGNDGAGNPVSLRELMVHMIEEYARHNGHADLLRERLDGRLGQ